MFSKKPQYTTSKMRLNRVIFKQNDSYNNDSFLNNWKNGF